MSFINLENFKIFLNQNASVFSLSLSQMNIKVVLILGANSDVAKKAILQYIQQGCKVFAASRNTHQLSEFGKEFHLDEKLYRIFSFDAEKFETHQNFYDQLPEKPNIVVYAAGFLVQNSDAFHHFDDAFKMMKVNYAGAVSILNIIASDYSNRGLERIIGLSSLSGVRGRKSNYIYGSTKSAFTEYLAGLRQELASRKIVVNVLVIGYINTKINQGLQLNKHLIMQPDYVAKFIVNVGSRFEIVPNWKWKMIYWVLKLSPEFLVAELP